MEIARDVARRLLEAQQERQDGTRLEPVRTSFDYPLVFGEWGDSTAFAIAKSPGVSGLRGFEQDCQAAGSHEIRFNPTTTQYTTVPNHSGDLPEGTLRAILRQAAVSVDEFLES
jgi:predicted RNA binding protein YcfA (HicA-like mRNA interferase family)